MNSKVKKKAMEQDLIKILAERYAFAPEARAQLNVLGSHLTRLMRAKTAIPPLTWHKVKESLRSVCLENPPKKTTRRTKSETFDQLVDTWKTKVFDKQVESSNLNKQYTPDELAIVLTERLNLEEKALEKLTPICTLWRKAVETGSPLEVMMDVIKKRCRAFSGKGYYDPYNKANSIIEQWFEMVHTEMTQPLVMSMVRAVLCD